MTDGKRGYIDVDSLQRELVAQGDAVERIAAFYHRTLPELHRTQNETRMACQFACGRAGLSGDRALSIKTQEDGAVFRCFQYGCTVRGNLLTLMYWLKHDHGPSGDRLHGVEFRAIANDLQALVRGETADNSATPKPAAAAATESPILLRNIPLKDSDNERARELVNLDEKFMLEPAGMSAKASSYVRRRPFMTPDLMRKFRCGYLANDAVSLLRGHFVYGWSDPEGNVLTWFGRNLNYEEQHSHWQRAGDSKDEPNKFRFVKGFHRGLELFGEDIYRREAHRELARKLGVIVVEGPNDVMNLHYLGIPAVAVCSNMVTDEQVEKLAALAKEYGDDTVSVMFDLDREGETGAERTVVALAAKCRVRLLWDSRFDAGRFIGRQPESVEIAEWVDHFCPQLNS